MTSNNQVTNVQALSQNLKKVIYDYTDGKYAKVCDYSQFKKTGTVLGKPYESWSEYIKTKYGDDEAFQSIVKSLKDIAKPTEELMHIIEKQPISTETIYRLERGCKSLSVGDIVEMGIRSATKDASFADRLFNQQMEGFDFEERHFKGSWTEYRFNNSKNLDVSSISAYKGQQEVLICGKYKVVNVETIENIKPSWKEVTISIKEDFKNRGIEAKHFTAKSGKEMIGYTEDGVEKSMPLFKYENGTVEKSIYDGRRQFGRDIVYLEVIE